MSSVRRKPAKALLCLVLALSVAAVFLLSSSAVFATDTVTNTVTNTKQFDCSFSTTGHSYFTYRVVGTANLQNALQMESLRQVEGQSNQYEAVLSANIEASDLFDEAYAYYHEKYENKHSVFGDYKNIVMSNKNGDGTAAFPTIEYEINFPNNITVNNLDKVTATENTNTISSITCKHENHHVHITMRLGNWDDYATFFTRVENELHENGHLISISIPVSIDTAAVKDDNWGEVTGIGSCNLYKFGHLRSGDNIVSVNSNNSWTITKEGVK